MSLNLGNVLANSACRYPYQTALIYGSERYAYEQLDEMARKFADALVADGIHCGDRVALMVPNSPTFTIAYFGVLYAGGVVVPLNALQTADEVSYQVADCEATALLLDEDCLQAGLAAYRQVPQCTALYVDTRSEPSQLPAESKLLADTLQRGSCSDVHQTQADETAVILYTSGTTGRPKGAELSHLNLYLNAKLLSENAYSIWPNEINVMGPGHVGLCAVPLYHIFGQSGLQNCFFFNGGAISCLKRFTPTGAASAIAGDRVTLFAGVPTMYYALLHDPDTQHADLSTVRFCLSAGAPLPVEVKRQFEARFGVRIQEAYGLTETSPLATMQAPNESSKAGTVGKPAHGVELRIVRMMTKSCRAVKRAKSSCAVTTS